MIGKARYYIIFNYFKYILIILFIFIGLLWLSQIIRIIELQFSISNQIIDVASTTLLALPSFVNPLVPFLIIIGSFMINTKIRSSNEIIIIKQYLSLDKIKFLFILFSILVFAIFTLNNEKISKNFYEKYKIKELEIRNNLKLGTPSQKEFHIDDIVSIFFEFEEEGVFYDIEAIFYNENQFIKSKLVEIELSKSNFNLVFSEGKRMILSKDEKSQMVFDKLTYVLENKKYEELHMDKDHYNTLELISHSNKEFKNYGHNKIFQYFFLFFVCLISFKIILFYKNKNSNIYHFSFIFFIILIVQIINSYLIYLLNNFEKFQVNHYYLICLFILLTAHYLSNKTIK